ncbi:GAF and ANTAR domain-containing protein [Hamadaea sp. NPDC051192]|uniref:GAF and ANTAR domain-containing protein n=1 Tax=Hamadaea sp. NPDC051192 TaxID=3154940 RepID=UPI003419B1DE
MVDRYAHVEALIRDEPRASDDQPGMAGGLRRLCGAAGRALAASGAGLTVMAAKGLRAVSAASDPATGRLEELQLTLGEGPCVEAYGLQRPVLVPDISDRTMTQWPVYAEAVHSLGVRAVFAFPLQIGAARLGVMDVFRGWRGMLTPAQLSLALTFADVAVATVLDGQRGLGRVGAGDGLGDPLGARAELFQAQGMVMVQLSVSLAEAMVRLRAYAFTHDQRLADVAADVVARRLVFSSDPQPPGTTNRLS